MLAVEQGHVVGDLPATYMVRLSDVPHRKAGEDHGLFGVLESEE